MMRVVLVGLGDIGSKLVRELARRHELVGVLDIADDKVDRTLRDLTQVDSELRVRHPEEVSLRALNADVLVHTAGTFLEHIAPTLIEALEAGMHIITTSEVMAYPWYRYPQLAEELDELARAKGKVLIGAGVNPGFIFDALPLLLSHVSLQLEQIEIKRMIDVRERREAFKRKYGYLLTEKEFRRGVEEGWLTGHVGYEESLLALADAMGVELEDVGSEQKPLIREGKVTGLKGRAWGIWRGRELFKLHLIATETPSRDELIIRGTPNYHWVAEGGVHGDLATVAAVLNSLKLVRELQPGIAKLKDLVRIGFNVR